MNDPSIPRPWSVASKNLFVLALCIAALGFSACRKVPHSPDGRVLIVEVQPGGAGELVGLRKGDRIVELRRASTPPANPLGTTLRPISCLAFARFEIEQGPRGPVEIDIERGDPKRGEAIEHRTFVLTADDWRLRLGTERSTTADAKAWDHLRQASVHADAHDMAKAEALYASAEHFALERRDERYVALVRQNRSNARIEALDLDGALRSLGARLYGQLLAPAAPWLARAERLRISADGPLAALPFAALVAPAPSSTGAAQSAVYLAERWPISTVVSATLAAELGRMRGEKPAAQALVAFGDPSYPTQMAASGTRGARPSSRFRLGLASLPASRIEVQGVAGLFRPAISYLGADATEARFLAEAPKGKIVHFAGHALLDPRFPLDSGLALSPPTRSARPGDDGLLQAWEIFERLRLSADLVTLSACETALGAEAQGEGLLGLTRAFHYAGARTVLSSLWSVSDRSTADLMRRFYRPLGAGAPKDAALAAAQREMLAGPNRHPYHWAAFQLDGDWR